jgi:23S rRNA-/tRNA-specific pseudouridylate synthase
VIVRSEGDLVAAIKPSGIPTVPDHAGSAHAFVASVAGAIGRKVDELRVTSRLDREVSGVVVFATSPDAEAALKDARARGDYVRTYLAIATNAGALPADGVWVGAIIRYACIVHVPAAPFSVTATTAARRVRRSGMDR